MSAPNQRFFVAISDTERNYIDDNLYAENEFWELLKRFARDDKMTNSELGYEIELIMETMIDTLREKIDPPKRGWREGE